MEMNKICKRRSRSVRGNDKYVKKITIEIDNTNAPWQAEII